MDEKTNSTFLDFNFPIIMHNFLNAAKRLIWVLLILCLIVGCATYVVTDRSYTPLYTSSVVLKVSANYASSTDILSYSSYMDASETLHMSQTFPYIIRSENTRMLLTKALGTSDIPGEISATSTAEVGLFTMSVTSTDPLDSFNVLNAVIEVYPQAASTILGDTQIEIIDPATEPSTVPINANTAMSAALSATAIVFVIGIVGIFLLSLTRKTVHSAEDLRKLVNLKCLSYIPAVQMKKHSNKSNLTLTITNPRINPVFNESVRNLRIKLQKALNSKTGQVLMITSTLPNEGKTTVSTNLALSLAAEGKKVILIDGDLRKQSLKETLGIDSPSDGLVEILSGNDRNFHLLNVPKSTLLLLSGDETIDEPQALLDSPRFQQVLELLRKKLDYVIVDTPPAGILSDAATIAKHTDATLYVVRQDLANTAQILDSIQALASGGVNLIGCVLNQTQAGTTRSGYGSKYSSGYGYAYGYKYAGRTYSYSSYGGRNRNRYIEAQEAADSLTQEISDTAELHEFEFFTDSSKT